MGTIRDMFSCSPPPVILATPLSPIFSCSSKIRLTYNLVGVSKSGVGNNFSVSIKRLTRLNPLLCNPLLARAIIVLPDLILSPLIISLRSAKPTQNPATSKPSLTITLGSSAVSPPTNLQPTLVQASAMPRITCVALSGISGLVA